MSLVVTYHCQALSTLGIWDHQLCSNILSAFFLANGDEMYHHSLTTMKSTLDDRLKKVRFIEHATGTTHFVTKDLPMLTFVTSPKLSTKKPRVWVSGLLPHMPRTPSPHLLPSHRLKLTPISNAFRRISLLPRHATRAMTLVIFVERKDIGQQMSKQGFLHNKASLRHCHAQLTLFGAFKTSWMWKSMWELQTLARRMRRTASKQAKLEKHSSNGHGVLVDGHTFHWCSKCMSSLFT